MTTTTPAPVDLKVAGGATFRQSFRWTAGGLPVNLTGWTARLQIRRGPKRDASAEVLLSLTETAGITLGGTLGTIEILITATQSAALEAAHPGTYDVMAIGVYDLELTAPGPGDVTRLLNGRVLLSIGVTLT